MNQTQNTEPIPGITATTAALREELTSGAMRTQQRLSLPDGFHAEVRVGRDSLWVIFGKQGAGGFALRTAYAPGTPLAVETLSSSKQDAAFRIASSVGEYQVVVQAANPDPESIVLRATVRLTPADALLLPHSPRDLYPLDAQGNPANAAGKIHAAQRGLNGGVLYLSLSEPETGSLLYFQNFTALNPYFEATGSKPDGAVGGQWPELGYQPPAACSNKALTPGQDIVLSDALLCFRPEIPSTPQESARLFLDMLACVYRDLEPPGTEFHNWTKKAHATLHDLANAPEATIHHYGHRYLHPYSATEYPDSMVQLTVLLPLLEYAQWSGKPIPLTDELRSGMRRFFDKNLGVVRRYLPNVGNDKNADEVDSWYLYHPLTNLARLAEQGDQEAKDWFLSSLDFGIRVAEHFHYEWPVQFDIHSLEVITGERKPGDPGQSDVGGLFAYICLQAYDLTGEERYRRQAKKAIRMLSTRTFDLLYQANITAWGASACIRLWRLTNDDTFRDQSYVFLAGFFHNTILWESQIDAAQHYRTFLGATCLHDGPYMALYECFEAFAAFQDCLETGGADLPDSVRLLLSEYNKYTLTRAWYYYPREIPNEILAQEIRNGKIERNLAFPLEDLYADGQAPGQVGQEIYGCGAAFVFTTRAFHRVAGAPFLIYSEYPLVVQEVQTNGESNRATGEKCMSFQVHGADGFTARVRLIPSGRKPVPVVYATTITSPSVATNETVLAIRETEEGHREFSAPTNQILNLVWH